MPWLPKPLKRKIASSSVPVVEIKSRSLSSESWHLEVINNTNIIHYLKTGESWNLPRLEDLKQTTSQYLDTNNVNVADCDSRLRSLIEHHISSYEDSKDLAVLACLHVLSLGSSIKYLVTLADLPVDRYLRCLSLVPQTSQLTIISERELEAVNALLDVHSGKDTGFTALIRLLNSAALIPNTALLPKHLVRNALVASKQRLRLSEFLKSLFQERKFMSAYLQISLLRNVPELTGNPEITVLLDELIPQWRQFISWTPNLNRIRQWEYGECTQREKFLQIFDLEGPSKEQACLKLLEPNCYQHVNIHPQNTETLERFLDLLYRSYVLGPSALELFIHCCMDNVANESSLALIEDHLGKNDDTKCRNQLNLLRVVQSKGGLARRVRDCIKFLRESRHSDVHNSEETLSQHVVTLMAEVQSQFIEQLEKTSGEYLGMMIYEFAHATKNTSWIHANLPKSFKTFISHIPQRQILEVIFRLLEEIETQTISESRMKRYLGSTLGAVSEYSNDQVSPELLKIEIEFWKQSPDSYRRDIAHALSKWGSVPYNLYIDLLNQTFNERDLYIQEMRHVIDDQSDQSCLNLAAYLSQRRKLNQLKHDCWLLLLAAMVTERLPTLSTTQHQYSSETWLDTMDNLSSLLGLIKAKLPHSGPGVTPATIAWWQRLSNHQSEMHFLINLKSRKSLTDLGAFYFLKSQDDMNPLASILSAVKQKHSTDPTTLKIFRHLSIDWVNAKQIYACNERLSLGTDVGRKVIDQTLNRHALRGHWSSEQIKLLMQNWFEDDTLSSEDKQNLREVEKLLGLRHQIIASKEVKKSTRQSLQDQYEELMKRAQILQNLTLQCRRRKPWAISEMLTSLGIEDSEAERLDTLEIPDALIDAVEVVGDRELELFELSFPVTEIQEVKKLAMGIPKDCKLLIVRLSLLYSPKFCIHFSPPESQGEHIYWSGTGWTSATVWKSPNTTTTCSQTTLFSCYLARILHTHLTSGKYDLENTHALIQSILKDPPSKCINCLSPIGTKLWKPASCSQNCSIQLRQFPLEIRLHNLFVDPLALDLLLTSVYCAAGDAAVNLLIGCPVTKQQVKSVIDSFQPMSSYAAASDIQAALRGNDRLGASREALLSWICLRFRGFIMTAPNRFRIPSMPGTTQFVVFNSNHEKEKAFNASFTVRGSIGGPVFHGTMPGRLFSILADGGLKNMSNTPYMLHGAASGAGIYLSDDQGLSNSYAGKIGISWANSQLSNMSVMLGCELANWTAKGTHVIQQESQVIVRYVFLLPQGYAPAMRQHVAPAMSSAFSNLRAS